MINDILFCLLGYTGGVFRESLEESNGFTVTNTIDCITESEKDLLKKIGNLGYKYKLLKDFVRNYHELSNLNMMKGFGIVGALNNFENINYEEKNENNESVNSIEINYSIYLSPICQSLNEYLKKYEEEVAALESKFYTNLILTGSEILSKLYKYSNVFDKIYEFLQFVTSRNLKGGDLLNFLHSTTITGDPDVKKVFKSFFINTNKIILNFIIFWIINGTITNNEFFITSVNNFIVKEDKEQSNLNYQMNNKSELESWSANYYIDYSNIPNYFPHILVEDILFIGKAIKILNSNKNSDVDKIPFNEISIFYTTLQKLNELSFNTEAESVNIINIELINKICNLIKTCTAKYLWKLFVNKKGFLDHLNAVKNMFLTFNGEFFYSFISKIKKLLNLPFDKKIEEEINEVYFKLSMKEIFNIDSDYNNEKLYSNFKIKLISSGFNYTFENSNVKKYVEKKEISFLGSINFDSYSESLRFINSSYKTQPGAIWNMTSFDVDEEFTMTCDFIIKNFTKPKSGMNDLNSSSNMLNNSSFNMVSPRIGRVKEVELLRSSLMKGKKVENDKLDITRKITINYIMHCSKNFEYKNSQPLNLKELFHYFNFQFVIQYENSNTNFQSNFNNFSTNNFNNPLLNSQQKAANFKISSMTFSLKYVNKIKKMNFNCDNCNYNIISENEIEIYKKEITEDLEFIFGENNSGNNIFKTNFQINFKDNFCNIFNENRTLNISFPLSINQFIPKDKRKMTFGCLIQSENMDVILDLLSWSFNFYSGEIYNENSNLILMDYNPPWPHNFLFNENIIKMYNLIFNLIFPLKTNLTLLNQLWIEKKNIAKKENFIFRLIDSVHSEFVCFLQNFISFYMFDVIDIKFKIFYEKIKDCQDFEQIIISHEEFLGEIIANSFVKRKMIMRLIFDILFTTRKFYNYVDNLLINFESQRIELDEENDQENIKEQYEIIKVNLMGIKEEFNIKVKNLISNFSKIKTTKYFAIISQLLTKLDYNFQMTE